MFKNLPYNANYDGAAEFSKREFQKEQDSLTIRELINSSGGKFCSVEFVKKNGDFRRLTIQPAAAKFHVKGDSASESAQKAVETRAKNHPDLINVWDVSDQKFKSFNVNSVLTIRVNGTTHEFKRLPAQK